jgi:hypothetical protein
VQMAGFVFPITFPEKNQLHNIKPNKVTLVEFKAISWILRILGIK